MGIIMGADTATNTQPAASPGRYGQFYRTLDTYQNEDFFVTLGHGSTDH